MPINVGVRLRRCDTRIPRNFVMLVDGAPTPSTDVLVLSLDAEEMRGELVHASDGFGWGNSVEVPGEIRVAME